MSDNSDNINDLDSGQDQVINLSYSLTRTDLFRYNLYFVRWLVVGSIVFFVLSITAFIMALNTPSGDLKTAIIWVVMGLGIGFSICAGSIAAILLQIFFVKNAAVERAMTRRNYSISSSGIEVFNEQGRITRTWQDIKKVIKTRHGFYIRTGDKVAIVIPRPVFADKSEIKLFENLARQVSN